MTQTLDKSPFALRRSVEWGSRSWDESLGVWPEVSIVCHFSDGYRNFT